jgi:hypothetical protein
MFLSLLRLDSPLGRVSQMRTAASRPPEMTYRPSCDTSSPFGTLTWLSNTATGSLIPVAVRSNNRTFVSTLTVTAPHRLPRPRCFVLSRVEPKSRDNATTSTEEVRKVSSSEDVDIDYAVGRARCEQRGGETDRGNVHGSIVCAGRRGLECGLSCWLWS